MNGDTGSAAGPGWRVDRGTWADLQDSSSNDAEEQQEQRPEDSNARAAPAAEGNDSRAAPAASGNDSRNWQGDASADGSATWSWNQEPAQGSWHEATSAGGSAGATAVGPTPPPPFNPWGSRQVPIRCCTCYVGWAPLGCKFDACLGCCPKERGGITCHRHLF